MFGGVIQLEMQLPGLMLCHALNIFIGTVITGIKHVVFNYAKFPQGFVVIALLI